MNEFIAISCLIGATQSLFLFLVLFFKQRNRRANRFLSLILLVSTLDLVEAYFVVKGYYVSFKSLVLSLIPYNFIYGPSIYIYSTLMMSGKASFDRRLLLLYLPFFPALAINIACIGTGTEEVAGVSPFVALNVLGLAFEWGLYTLTFYRLWNYSRRIKEYFSDIRQLQLHWLKSAIAGLFIIEFSIHLHFYLGIHGREGTCIVDILATIGGLALLFTMSFLAVIQPEMFHRIRVMVAETTTPRYEKLRLPEPLEKDLAEKITAYMIKEKPYLDEDLTLQDLADRLTIGAVRLSMILNLHLKQNFYHFINSYRVREVQEKLADPNNSGATILNIAYSVGFNSKSTFNSIFKKTTGTTPQQYRREIMRRQSGAPKKTV